MSGRNETLIVTIARLLRGVRTVAVGAASPIPAAATMLVRATQETPPVRISVLGSARHNFFTNGVVELFDAAGQGRIDAFFLGGGQIDGSANVNLVGAGEYPATKVRWPGCFGSSYLYFVVPRVILFREEHTRRVLVDKVDFVSAPGTSDSHVYRQGGPAALLTSKCLFDFDRAKGRFRLASLHAGVTLEDVRDNTGFDFDVRPDLGTTPGPTAEEAAVLRERIVGELAETYPDFAQKLARELATA